MSGDGTKKRGTETGKASALHNSTTTRVETPNSSWGTEDDGGHQAVVWFCLNSQPPSPAAHSGTEVCLSLICPEMFENARGTSKIPTRSAGHCSSGT